MVNIMENTSLRTNVVLFQAPYPFKDVWHLWQKNYRLYSISSGTKADETKTSISKNIKATCCSVLARWQSLNLHIHADLHHVYKSVQDVPYLNHAPILGRTRATASKAPEHLGRNEWSDWWMANTLRFPIPKVRYVSSLEGSHSESIGPKWTI